MAGSLPAAQPGTEHMRSQRLGVNTPVTVLSKDPEVVSLVAAPGCFTAFGLSNHNVCGRVIRRRCGVLRRYEVYFIASRICIIAGHCSRSRIQAVKSVCFTRIRRCDIKSELTRCLTVVVIGKLTVGISESCCCAVEYTNLHNFTGAPKHCVGGVVIRVGAQICLCCHVVLCQIICLGNDTNVDAVLVNSFYIFLDIGAGRDCYGCYSHQQKLK